MRITSNMMSQGLILNLESDQDKINNLQNQLSTGVRINKPSDDPIGIENAMRLKNNIANVTQWDSNANEALQFMNTTDGTLADMTSILQKVRELAVEGANGTMTTDDTSAIADEVSQLSDQLKLMANTQVGSKYIFSGTATDKPLIPTDGSTSQANGDEVKFQVGNNLNISVSVSGQALFGDATTGIFATLSNLTTALKNNDSAAVSGLLDNIDANVDNVIAQRSDLGARTNRMSAIQSQLDSTTLNLQQNLSTVQDTDLAKAITDFTNQQNSYKAALAVGAQIIQVSLVDFMK